MFLFRRDFWQLVIVLVVLLIGGLIIKEIIKPYTLSVRELTECLINDGIEVKSLNNDETCIAANRNGCVTQQRAFQAKDGTEGLVTYDSDSCQVSFNK